MRDWLIHQAKRVFRRLALSPEQKMKLAYQVFDIAGDRLNFLPSYTHYKREKIWSLKLPKDLPRYREETLAKDYDADKRPTFLMINHALGGGTGQHVEQLAAALAREGVRTLLLQKHDDDHLRVYPFPRGDVPPLFFRWPEELGQLADLKSRLHLRHIHLHHTMDMPVDFLPRFAAFVARTGLPYDYTVHDYFSICPRFTLFDETVRGYCGEPSDTRKCNACVHSTGSAAGRDVDVRVWRHDYAEMMSDARQVFVPDSDVMQRMRRYAPAANLVLKPHSEENHSITPVAARQRPGEVLRVVTLGGIAPHKGSKVLLDCAEDALKRKLPIEFTLIGYSDIDHKLKSLKNMTVTGQFDAKDLPAMLQKGQFHVAFLPSVIPETYNYTLSECWRAGLFTACFNIGAIASRIRTAQFGSVLPLEWYFYPDKINDHLLSMPVLQLLEPQKLAQHLHQYPAILNDYYGLYL